MTSSRNARRFRLATIALVAVAALASPAAVLAARAWTLSASPTNLPAGTAVTVTLTVQNVGSSSGGDEMTCVQVSVPSAFAVSSATIVSVKGVTSATSHGWVVVTGSAAGRTIVTFKNPPDKNPLVGLPVGDSAVFRISGAASGSMTWTATAADKPGGSTSTSCGSGTFPTMSLTFSVGSSPTPTPTATPFPTPTPTPTPKPTPKPTATPAPTPQPTPGRSPTPGPRSSQPASASVLPSPAISSAPSSEPGSSIVPSGAPSSGPLGGGPADPTPAAGGGATAGSADDGSARPPGDSSFTGQLSIPLGPAAHGDGEVVAGLNDTLRSALLDIGVIGWTVPALALSVPGILLIIVIGLQLLGGAAWLPVTRRILSRAGAPGSTAASRRRDPGRRPGR